MILDRLKLSDKIEAMKIALMNLKDKEDTSDKL